MTRLMRPTFLLLMWTIFSVSYSKNISTPFLAQEDMVVYGRRHLLIKIKIIVGKWKILSLSLLLRHLPQTLHRSYLCQLGEPIDTGGWPLNFTAYMFSTTTQSSRACFLHALIFLNIMNIYQTYLESGLQYTKYSKYICRTIFVCSKPEKSAKT